VIDHAIVATELTARGALRFRDHIVTQGSNDPEARHSLVNFVAGLAPKLEIHGVYLSIGRAERRFGIALPPLIAEPSLVLDGICPL
jgi:hypothetical protein